MRRRVLLGLACGLLLCVGASHAQTSFTSRLHTAIVAAGVPITSVSIGKVADKTTWRVTPTNLQGAAQPTIDAFDPADPAHEQAALDAQATRALDAERLSSAIVWTILKQMYPMDTDAQTKTKYGVARTRIITAFKATPWK